VIHINYVEKNEKKQENITKQTCNTVVTGSGIFKFACIKFFYAKNSITIDTKKSIPLSLLSVIYLYKISLSVQRREITPSVRIHFKKSARCLFLLRFNAYDTFVHKMEYKLWRFCSIAGGSEITPFHLLYLQEVPGAYPRMDSMYMIHLSTNWDTSCEGSD
jgi:hypothetical protein